MVEIEIEEPVDFVPLWGATIPGVLVGVTESDDDEISAEVVMTPAAFARVIGTESFALLDEALTQGRPDELDPAEPVRLRLRLRSGVHAFVGSMEEDLAPAIARALVEEQPLSRTLRQTEAWLLCTATQRIEVPDDPDAVAEIGIETAWA